MYCITHILDFLTLALNVLRATEMFWRRGPDDSGVEKVASCVVFGAKSVFYLELIAIFYIT